MPTTANTINYFVAADGTLRDGPQGSIAQTPRINYGTEYSVTLTFPASTIAEGDQLQVAVNRTRTFFSSASATGDAPVAAVAKHDVTAEEAAAQAVTLTLSTNTRAMIDQVNGIDHPVRGFFGVHVLRGQSFVTLAVTDALMMSLESGPDAISPPLPILDYPTRQEMNDAVEAAQNSASAAKTSEDNADASASAAARDAQAAGQSATNAGNSATLAESYAHGGTGTRQGEDTDNAKYYLEQLGDHEAQAKAAAQAAAGSATAAAGFATQAATAAGNAAGSATQAGQAATAATTAKNAAETAQGKAEAAQGKSEQAQAKAEQAQESAETAQTDAETAQGKAEDAQAAAESAQGLAEDAQDAAETARDAAVTAKGAAETAESNAAKIAEGTDEEVAPLGLEHSAKGWAEEASERMTVVTIPAATTTYTLQDNKHYQQVPSAVPTYTLPTATMDGLVHEITVLVDFMHVTSCSFVDAGGVPVTLQSAISPQIGEAYIFRCYWYGKWRVVPLKIRNAATASSATGVVEVSDAVAGDALALRMVAPRSVVVNQGVQNGNFADGTNNINSTGYIAISANNNVLTVTTDGIHMPSSASVVFKHNAIVEGHSYLFTFTIKKSVNGSIGSIIGNTFKNHGSAFVANTSYILSQRVSSADTTNDRVWIYPFNNYTGTEVNTAEISNVMLVDLTQYFNGNQTLIDSITSWDDLVAYDPRFVSYVAYNTGEVVGVQPTVKVSGKNIAQYNSMTFNYNSTDRIKDFDLGLTESVVRRLSGKQMTISYGNPDENLCLTFIVQGTFSSGVVFKSFGYSDKGVSSQSGIINLNDMKWFKSATMRLYNRDNATGSITPTTVQLELGSSATAYEPYHEGGTAQAPAPLFAVGSAADEFEAVSGVTTRKMASVDLGTLNWTRSLINERYIFIASVPGKKTGNNIINFKYVVSSILSQNVDKTINATQGNSNVYIRDDAYSDAATFKAAMSGVMLYYELATPTTSQSTPTQISLQAGNNVAMQTDGGRTLAELSMTYENLPAAD